MALPDLITIPTAAAQIFGSVPDIGGGNEDIRTTTINILNSILTFMALAAVALIVIAGIYLIFSQGGEEQTGKGKKFMLYLIIGMILILFAQGIVGFIANSVAPAAGN